MKTTHWEALAGLVYGWVLCSVGFRAELPLLLLCLPVGTIAVASSTGILLWRGDDRLPEMLALSAVLGIFPALGLLIAGQWLFSLFVIAIAMLSWLVSGRQSLAQYPAVGGAPAATNDLPNALRISTDQALLAWFKLLLRSPRGDDRDRVLMEFAQWEKEIEAGFDGDFSRYHPEPPELLRVESRERQLFSLKYRHVSWDSEFPEADLPGAARWQHRKKSRQAHAWVLEHSGKPRPWLLTIHGYRMGSPLLDMRAFEPEYLHKKLGLNIASVVLPLHGPRREGLVSGAGYLEGDFSNFIHAERQAAWDIRRLLSWIRLNRHAPSVGLYGISLGGYNASLLAGLDDDLACVVAGIPVFDMATTVWRHMPEAEKRLLEADGISKQRLQGIFAPVSPVCFSPRLPSDNLGIFAGTADTLVLPDQALSLAAHWGGIRPYWYSGSHLTFAGTAAHRQCLLDTLAAGNLI